MIVYVDFSIGQIISKEQYYIMENALFECWQKYRINQSVRYAQFEANLESFKL